MAKIIRLQSAIIEIETKTMYEDDIRQDDVGIIFRIDVGTDLSLATNYRIEVITPTGETIWTKAELTVTSGDTDYYETSGDTILKYTSISEDFSEIGKYKAIAYVEWGSTVKQRGDPAIFLVKLKSKE